MIAQPRYVIAGGLVLLCGVSSSVLLLQYCWITGGQSRKEVDTTTPHELDGHARVGDNPDPLTKSSTRKQDILTPTRLPLLDMVR